VLKKKTAKTAKSAKKELGCFFYKKCQI